MEPFPSSPAPPVGKRGIVVIGLVLLLVLFVNGIIGLFRLSAGAAALSSGLKNASSKEWRTKLVLHAGWLTTGLARTGLQFVKLEPEPRAVVAALRGAEVGIYTLPPESRSINAGAAFAAADRVMTARGWDRIVGVMKERTAAVFYVPHKRGWSKRLTCCFGVVQGDTLVVGSVQGNPQSLIDLARERWADRR